MVNHSAVMSKSACDSDFAAPARVVSELTTTRHSGTIGAETGVQNASLHVPGWREPCASEDERIGAGFGARRAPKRPTQGEI